LKEGFITLPFDLSYCGFFFLGNDGQLSLQLWIIQKTQCFLFCYDLVEKRPTSVSTINQATASGHAIVILVLRQDTWNTVLGTMRHAQVIRQNFVSSTMANPCCRCDFIYIWEQLACTYVAASWILSSVLTVLGQLV
jgi:hypothetical protein